MDRGSFIDYDGRPAVRFERSFPHPVERVWRAISSPDQLACWFPSRVELEERVGGAVRFSGDPDVEASSGAVLVFEPPRDLAFTWGADELHLRLDPVGESSCRLILVNVLEARDAAARNAAGWAVCLGELTALLASGSAAGPHGEAASSWRGHYDRYVADGLPSGAHVPGDG